MLQFKDDVTGQRFAYLTLIAFGEKVRDDALDGNKTRAFFVNSLFKKQFAQAKEKYPTLAKLSFESTDEVNRLQDGGEELFTVLNAYGATASELFREMGISDPRFLEVYAAILVWTFYIDMLCDYEDDYKEKAYNGFYDAECPTLEKLFDKHYAFILESNLKISKRIVNALNAINDDSMEWKIVYRVMEYSLNTVAFNLLEGKDVKFHYFKELRKNWKLGRKGENESNFS